MADWIKMRADLYTHPKFIALCTALIHDDSRIGIFVYACGKDNLPIDVFPPERRSVSEYALQNVTTVALRDVTMCALLRVWCAVNSHCSVDGEDAIFPYLIVEEIDEIAGIEGFGASMEEVGWVYDDKERKRLVFPNFLEFNQPACLRREPLTNAERQQRLRERRKGENGTVTKVTKSNGRLDKRRLDKKNPPTPLGGGESLGSAADIEALWAALWVRVPMPAKAKLHDGRRKALGVGLGEHSIADLVRAWEWVNLDGSEAAKLIREKWHGLDTFLRPENTQRYIEIAATALSKKSGKAAKALTLARSMRAEQEEQEKKAAEQKERDRKILEAWDKLSDESKSVIRERIYKDVPIAKSSQGAFELALCTKWKDLDI